MSVQDLPTNNVRPGACLHDALHQWRDTAWTVTSECHVPEHRVIDANRATIERAKIVLMRRYGMNTFQAFSMLVRWARETHTPVHTLAMTIVHGTEADPQPEGRHLSLASLPTPPDWWPSPVAQDSASA